MVRKNKEELVDGILGNKNKFRRAIVVLLIVGAVACFSIYYGDRIADIIRAVRGVPVQSDKPGE